MRFGPRACEAGSRASSAPSASSRWRAAGSTRSSTLQPGTSAEPSLSRMIRSIPAAALPNSASKMPACFPTKPKRPAGSAMPVMISRQPSPSAMSSQSPLPTPHRAVLVVSDLEKAVVLLPFAEILLPSRREKPELATHEAADTALSVRPVPQTGRGRSRSTPKGGRCRRQTAKSPTAAWRSAFPGGSGRRRGYSLSRRPPHRAAGGAGCRASAKQDEDLGGGPRQCRDHRSGGFRLPIVGDLHDCPTRTG